MEKEKVKGKKSTRIALLLRTLASRIFSWDVHRRHKYTSSSSIRARFCTLMCFPTSVLYPLYFLMIDDTVWMKHCWFALLPTKGGGTPTLTGCHWTHQSLGLIDFYFHSRAVSLSCSTLISLPPHHPNPKKCSHMLRLSLHCSWVGFQRNNFTVVIAEKKKKNLAQNLNHNADSPPTNSHWVPNTSVNFMNSKSKDSALSVSKLLDVSFYLVRALMC